ncbi:hypothetical protein Tco_0640745 [Tanacetum coccineum]
MANEPKEVRDAIIKQLRSEQEKEYHLVNNLLGEMNRYMLQKLDRAEDEMRTTREKVLAALIREKNSSRVTEQYNSLSSRIVS